MTYDASLLLWIMLWAVVIVLIVTLMGLYRLIGRVDDLERAWWEATETIYPSKTGESLTDSPNKLAGTSGTDDTAELGGFATSAEYWSHQERATGTDSNARREDRPLSFVVNDQTYDRLNELNHRTDLTPDEAIQEWKVMSEESFGLAWCKCGHRRDIHDESDPIEGCRSDDCYCTKVYQQRLNVGATYYE